MDQDIEIINTNTRNEKIKNFFIKNKKYLIKFLSIIIVIVFAYFAYNGIQDKNIKKLAEKYNNILVEFENSNKTDSKKKLIEIIYEKNSTYSPLALYFIIDNDIDSTKEEINEYFDIIIKNVRLEKEIKNLIIYKKGLFNSDFETENNLIKILNPLLNSSSIWKSHALYLLGEYFLSRNEKQKAKEFFENILILDNSNVSIKNEAQKRIQNDFTE